MYAEELLIPWLQAVRDAVPGLDVVDVHVHVGLADPGGLLATEEEALASLALAGAHGVVFPLKEPAGYRRPNDAVLDLAHRSAGRVSVLARLDPADDPLGEARRCLAAGAVGLKLHPRGEGFALDDRRLDGVFALADERRLPLMVHAGRGVAEMTDAVLRRSHDHPQARIVLAHCATRILFGSDIPFATTTQQVVQAVRPALERMYVSLLAACERMLGGEDPGQEMLLVRDGCTVGTDGPDGPVLRAISALLDQVEGRTEPDPLRPERTPGFDLALVAATVARTPAAPLPGHD